MFYQIFHSPHVKESAIISNKQGIYEFPHDSPLGWLSCPHKKKKRLRILGNYENSGKTQYLLEL